MPELQGVARQRPGALARRRGEGVAGPRSPLARDRWGSPSATSALPVKEMWCSAALRVLPLRLNKRDDSLTIHGHGGRDERELPDAQNPRELAA
jgi:hypothetical protein